MAQNAKLMVILMADKTKVAESDDRILWQNVLGAIHGSDSTLSSVLRNAAGARPPAGSESQFGQKGGSGSGPLGTLAAKAEVSTSELQAALSPTTEAPYMRIDKRYWAAAKKGTPRRGTGAVNPTGLFATFLCLWFEEAKLGVVKQKTVLDTMDEAGVTDPNASRGIANTRWIQSRAKDGVILNPVEIEEALRMLRKFCKKEWGSVGKEA